MSMIREHALIHQRNGLKKEHTSTFKDVVVVKDGELLVEEYLNNQRYALPQVDDLMIRYIIPSLLSVR
jgi:hypothetical protein